jgi:hypothetical protein
MLIRYSAMATVTPSSLPPIDAVDVVDLSEVDADRVDGYMEAAADAPRVRVSGPEAERIAALWRELPAGEQGRCHIPPFGLRFYSGGRLLGRASICWHCNNIFGDAGDEHLFFAFDAARPKSRELLAECERIVGRPAAE